MRGTILRIADLRSQSAYIRVAVRRPTLSRRMVECFLALRPSMGERRSSRHPVVKAASLTLTSGPRRLPRATKRRTPGSSRSETNYSSYLTGRSTSGDLRLIDPFWVDSQGRDELALT